VDHGTQWQYFGSTIYIGFLSVLYSMKWRSEHCVMIRGIIIYFHCFYKFTWHYARVATL
jgi:hypothetical protein